MRIYGVHLREGIPGRLESDRGVERGIGSVLWVVPYVAILGIFLLFGYEVGTFLFGG